MKKKILATLLFVLIAVVFAVKSFAGVDPYNAYQNRMQLYTSQFYLTIDSLDALTRKLDSLIAGQNADTAYVRKLRDSLTVVHTAIGTLQSDMTVTLDSLALVFIQANAAHATAVIDSGLLAALQADMTINLDSLALVYTQAKAAHDAAVRDSTALAKAQDSLNYLKTLDGSIYALVDTAAWRGWIPFLSGATSLPSETTDTIATVTGDVRIAILGFRVTTALATEYVKLGFWANNTDGVAVATALCDSAGMSDLTGSAAGVALNLTGVFANNPTVTAFNVSAVSGDPTVIRVKNCVLTVGCATTVTASGKVRYYMLWQPVSTGSRVTAN